MSRSTQQKPVVITVDQDGFDALIPSQLPEGIFVYDKSTGSTYLSVSFAGVMTLAKLANVKFTAAQLQQFRLGKAGTGANQLNEPSIRIKSDGLGNHIAIPSFRGFLVNDASSGAYVHVGTRAGGAAAQPSSAVLRARLALGQGSGDVDPSFAPAKNGLGNYNLYVGHPTNFDTELTVSESQDYGLTFSDLPPITGPSIGGTDLDREWLDSFGVGTLLVTLWSDNGVNVLRTDAFGAPLVKISQIITAPDFRWGSYWNRQGGSGQLRLQIDKINTAGTVPPPVPNQLKKPFWCYFGVGSPAAPPDSDPVTTIWFYSSRDGGYTWSAPSVVASVPAVDPLGMLGTFNDLSIAPDGSLWIAYSNMLDVFVTHSTNHGATWSAPLKVSTPTTAFARFPKIIATDRGMGLMFVGTPGPTEDGPWTVYYTTSNPKGTVWAVPTDVVGIVTHGVVRNDNGFEDRMLWDLFGLDVDGEGWAHMVFGADGNSTFGTISTAVQGVGQGGVGDNAIAVDPIAIPIENGQEINFSGGTVAIVTADAPIGTAVLSVVALLAPVAAGEGAVLNPPSSYYAVQTSGPRLGKTNY